MLLVSVMKSVNDHGVSSKEVQSTSQEVPRVLRSK